MEKKYRNQIVDTKRIDKSDDRVSAAYNVTEQRRNHQSKRRGTYMEISHTVT